MYIKNQKDTIAAISTATGEAAIAIVRITGKDTIEITNKIFSGDISSYKSHTVHFGKILDNNGQPIDQVLLVLMKAPNTYTGEDIIEIQCHGSNIITKKILQEVIDAGARAAMPGEFTFRAFINKKIDLAQAEAVQELISSNNDLALGFAEKNLSGHLSDQILSYKKELTEIAAILEAWVDFPEEGLEFASFEEVINSLEKILQKMKKLSSTYHEGKMISTGINLSIIGSPNVGKSSLMNALLKRERAIVTPIAGTTRDVLKEDLKLKNLHFRLTDTAGIRTTKEVIEQEGIKRSKEVIKEADLNLLVLDATRKLNSDDLQLLKEIDKNKTIVVWNKIDINKPTESIDLPNIHHISAKEKIGIESLQELIEKVVLKKGLPSKEELIITNLRHKSSLDNTIDFCERIICGLKENISAEFINVDMKNCLNELNNIIGTDITEDILNSIFSKFCIGK